MGPSFMTQPINSKRLQGNGRALRVLLAVSIHPDPLRTVALQIIGNTLNLRVTDLDGPNFTCSRPNRGDLAGEQAVRRLVDDEHGRLRLTELAREKLCNGAGDRQVHPFRWRDRIVAGVLVERMLLTI